jgi:hypothetical protein
MSEDAARLECARVRIGAALLEAHHLMAQYRDALHRLEQAYMDLGMVMASSSGVGAALDFADDGA